MENNDAISYNCYTGLYYNSFLSIVWQENLCILILKLTWYLACLYIKKKKTSEYSYSAYIALNKVHLYILEFLSGTFCQVSDFPGHQVDHLAWGAGRDQNICMHSQIRKLNQFSCPKSLFLSASRTLST